MAYPRLTPIGMKPVSTPNVRLCLHAFDGAPPRQALYFRQLRYGLQPADTPIPHSVRQRADYWVRLGDPCESRVLKGSAARPFGEDLRLV